MASKVISGALVYCAITFVLGPLWHFFLFPAVYADLGVYTREPPSLPLGFTSMATQGVCLAYLFHRFRRTSALSEALAFAGCTGVLMYSLSTVAYAAKNAVAPLPLWFGVQLAFHVVQFGLLGLAYGVVYRNTPAERAAA